MMDQPNDKINFPGVEFAYPLAIASYDTMQKRMDVVETRLQTLIAFATTLTGALIAVVAGKGFNFHSRIFFAAMVFYLAGAGVGFGARLWGRLKLFDPSKAYDKALRWPETEFKKRAIYFAGMAFADNRRVINLKGSLSTVSAILFLVEATLLAVWMARS